MKQYRVLFIFVLIFFSISCEHKDDSGLSYQNCDNLKNGIITTDDSIIITVISKLTTDLSPNPTENDPLGHMVNFETLISRINTCGQITAELTCYGCIKTLPALSEILVKTDSSGVQIQRYLDIKTSEQSNLDILGIHQAP
jgi:hypothetical protein